MFVFAFLVSLGTAQAECIDWQGLISDTHPILTQTKHVSLALGEDSDVVSLALGEPDCIDAQTCVWSLDTELGVLEAESGGSNTYTPPESLEGCEIRSTVVSVQCSDADGATFTDEAEITIACGDIDDDNPANWSASGGGCNSPSYALILPFLCLFRARRQTFS